MFWLILLFVLAIIVLIIVKGKTIESVAGSYRSRKFILSKTELSFYRNLREICPPNRAIMCKVSLKDIIETSSNNKQQRSRDWGAIKSKHIDFLIIDSENAMIKCCIELDDNSHNSQAAQKRDDVKNKALQSAGIPLHRIKVSTTYPKDHIASILNAP